MCPLQARNGRPWSPPASAAAQPPAKYAYRKPRGVIDLQGTYTDKDENGCMEKPQRFAGEPPQEVDIPARRHRPRTPAARRRRRAAIGGTPARSRHYSTGVKNSRAWLVLDPPDGRTPEQVPAVAQRNAARAAARGARGAADSYEDRSLYDRCITRGIVGSMLPVIYGNSFQFVQGQGYVAIRYEMIHETRVVPLTPRARISPKLRSFGDPRGHFEGNTLVVETTNFTDRTALGVNGGGVRHSEKLKLTERFTPVSRDKLDWRVTVEDPDTWSKPWSFGLTLTKDASQPVFEYACHEGNYAMKNILSAARSEEKEAAARK